MRSSAAALLITTAVTLAACGGDDSSDDSDRASKDADAVLEETAAAFGKVKTTTSRARRPTPRTVRSRSAATSRTTGGSP